MINPWRCSECRVDSDIKMMVNIEMLGMWNASDIKIIINIKMFGI